MALECNVSLGCIERGRFAVFLYENICMRCAVDHWYSLLSVLSSPIAVLLCLWLFRRHCSEPYFLCALVCAWVRACSRRWGQLLYHWKRHQTFASVAGLVHCSVDAMFLNPHAINSGSAALEAKLYENADVRRQPFNDSHFVWKRRNVKLYCSSDYAHAYSSYVVFVNSVVIWITWL